MGKIVSPAARGTKIFFFLQKIKWQSAVAGVFFEQRAKRNMADTFDFSKFR